jgi:hypothetical protein
VVVVASASARGRVTEAHRLAALHQRRLIRPPQGPRSSSARKSRKRGLRCGVSGRGSVQFGRGNAGGMGLARTAKRIRAQPRPSRSGCAFAPPSPRRPAPQAASPRSGRGTGRPRPPGNVCASHVRGRRILLRLQDASRKRPSRTGHGEHTSGSECGDTYPHHEMFRTSRTRMNHSPSFRGARLRASPGSMITNEISAVMDSGPAPSGASRNDEAGSTSERRVSTFGHSPGLRCAPSGYACSTLSTVIPGRASPREPGIHA